MNRKNLYIAFGVIALVIVGALLITFRLVKEVGYRTTPEDSPSALSELTNGSEEWLGVFRDSPIVHDKKYFASSELGISFTYPRGFLLFEHRNDADAFYESHNITMGPEGPALESIERARAGISSEGPPGIHFTFYRSPDSRMTLEEWIYADPRSNFHLSAPGGERGALTPTTVAGSPAFAYQGDGLYVYDYVAFKHRDWMVLAAAARTDEFPGSDFSDILSSIQLAQ